MSREAELIDKITQFGYIVKASTYKDQEQADKGNHTNRYWTISEENSLLQNTAFYNTERDFIHFTTIEALYGMLNSKHFRLYNLVNMDDKMELEYARKALSFATIDEQYKEEIFCFSMCSSSVILNEEPKKKKHLLWKLHGKDGKGVVIRLKIMNDPVSWRNYYLTECFYDLERFQPIKDLNEITKRERLDMKPCSFIKLPIYEFENEIRLLFDHRSSGTISYEGKDLYPITYQDKLLKPEKIYYFQLPIFNFYTGDEEAYPNPPDFGMGKGQEIPKISITEIILGYRYSEEDLKNLKEKMKLYDPNINVRLSDLKQYY